MSERKVLPYALGFVTLGDLVQPVIEPGTQALLEQSIHGTTYRPDQMQGRLQLVAYPEGHPEHAVSLLDRSIDVGGKHPGTELYKIDLKVLTNNEIEVHAQSISTESTLLLERLEYPGDLKSFETVDCPCAEELEARLMAMYAEVMMRWFRGLLREREVRIGTRDIVYETRDATTALESAIDSEDVDTLRQQIGVLRHYGEEVCQRTSLTAFPSQMPLIFFPEAS